MVLAGGLWVSACQKPPVSDPRPRKLHVAAAADLRYAFEVMRVQFEAVHPGVQLKLSYGSSGQFFAQIRNGAPFDLYFSADVDYPQRLIAEGLAVDTSFFSLCRWPARCVGAQRFAAEARALGGAGRT